MASTQQQDYTPWLGWIDSRFGWMRDTLIDLARINSGSHNVAGVNRVGDAMTALLTPLTDSCERVTLPAMDYIDDDGQPAQRPLGNAIRARKRTKTPVRALLCGHLDTVFGPEHPFQDVRTTAGNRLNGPGVADLKGGLVVMLTALQALERSPWAQRIGWEVLLNPDEEIGSPGSAALLAEAAPRHHAGLVYEPAMPDGSLAGRRKGSGNFTIVAHGRAAHAGREHHLGRNAVRALADCTRAIDQLNGRREGITVNPAFIHGGGAMNIVPDRALLRFNVRIAEPEDEAWFLRELDAIIAGINERDGIRLERHGHFTRKPKLLDAAHRRLFALAADCGEHLGMPLQWRPTGGCCDGNNLAAAGLPNIDTLGVVGGHIHSDAEYVELDSLVARAKLSALLLMRLAAGDFGR